MRWNIYFLLFLSACSIADRAPPQIKPSSHPPYAACLPKPAPLPPIATVEQVKARHDALDKLYLDCAARLRANLDSLK